MSNVRYAIIYIIFNIGFKLLFNGNEHVMEITNEQDFESLSEINSNLIIKILLHM